MNYDTKLHITSVRELYGQDCPVDTFVDAVLIRPKMYTINGTFEEVGAFIWGFYSGLPIDNPNAQADEQSQNWLRFCLWAHQRLLGESSFSWQSLFQAIRSECQDDTMAFKQLALLYLEFTGRLSTRS